jgi:hypothetical protein
VKVMVHAVEVALGIAVGSVVAVGPPGVWVGCIGVELGGTTVLVRVLVGGALVAVGGTTTVEVGVPWTGIEQPGYLKLPMRVRQLKLPVVE